MCTLSVAPTSAPTLLGMVTSKPSVISSGTVSRWVLGSLGLCVDVGMSDPWKPWLSREYCQSSILFASQPRVTLPHSIRYMWCIMYDMICDVWCMMCNLLWAVSHVTLPHSIRYMWCIMYDMICDVWCMMCNLLWAVSHVTLPHSIRYMWCIMYDMICDVMYDV